VFRAPTYRHNISYYIKDVRGTNLTDRDALLVAIVRRPRRERIGRRTIVYGSSVNTVERLASALRLRAFHRLADGSNTTLGTFYDDPSGILVTTNYFGASMDPEDVGLVVYYRTPATLLEYI